MTADELNPRQIAVLKMLTQHHALGTNAIGWRLRRSGLTKSNRKLNGGNCILPATSVMRSLEKLGMVSSFPSDRFSKWSVKMWCIKQAGQDALREGEST